MMEYVQYRRGRLRAAAFLMLSVMLLFSMMFPWTAAAEPVDAAGRHDDGGTSGILKLSVPSKVKSGDTLTVKLKAEKASDLYAAYAVVHYDPDKLEFQSAAGLGSFKRGSEVFFKADSSTPGQVEVIASLLGNHKVRKGQAEIASITWKVKDAAADSSTEITLDKESLTAKSDAGETGITFPLGQDQTEQVTITSSQYVREDVDRSGRVDLKDLALVTSHVGKKLTDKNRVYDVNDDGTINLVDVALVTKKIHDSKGGGKR